MKINSEYQKMITQIKIDADKFADEQMKTVYKNQKDHLTELHKYLGLLFIGYAVDGLLKVTPYQKSNILVDLNLKLTNMAKDMGNTEINQVTEILKKNFSDTYYKNAYIMDSGMKINLKFDILKKEFIDVAVNNPVDGELFSKRIWANKAAVADKIKQGIVDAMNGNVTIDKLGKDIQHTFNVGAYESQRLVNTENARVQGQAIDDIGKNAGCTQQMYCATLEHNTCAECAELDGQYFDIDDESKPDIPQHPNCRCLYINVPLIGWEPTVRKDNESKGIIDYEDYNKWLKDKYIDINGNNDIISDKKWLNSNFSTEKKFNKHIEKHLEQYGGDATPEEYLNTARKLLSASLSDDVEGFISEDDFVFKYRKSTNDFAIGRPDGKISTLYKPDLGLEYWKGEIKNHGKHKKM